MRPESQALRQSLEALFHPAVAPARRPPSLTTTNARTAAAAPPAPAATADGDAAAHPLRIRGVRLEPESAIWIWHFPSAVECEPLSPFVGKSGFLLLTSTHRFNGEDQFTLAPQFLQDSARQCQFRLALMGGYIHRSELPLDVFAPVNLQSARKLLAAFSLLPTEYRLMPLLARCRHVEPSEEIFIGIDPKDSTRAIRISSRGLESLESLTNQAPADLLFEMEGDVCGRIEQVVAKYDFLGEESLNNDLQCKIALHVRSGTTQNCLQAPLYPTSAHLEYTFVNSVHDSASHSATLGLRDELSKLGTWFSRSLDDSECPEPANASGIGEIFHRWSYEEPKLMEQDERTSPVLYAANRQLDFVERLWHYCCGEAEQRVPSIIRALRLELEAGGLQAMINKNNRTALSSVIRECLRLSHKQLFKDRDETVAVVKESLDSLEKSPFEYLVEAGIYKLRRDYSTILICSGVSTWENLEFFNDYQISLSDQIKKLALLHDVTEAFCTLSQSVLGLPTMIMRELVQSIVDFFKRKYETEQIEAAASAESDVMRLVEVVSKTFTPSSWQANFGPSAAKTRHILQLKRADSCLEFEANELRGVDWKLYVGKL